MSSVSASGEPEGIGETQNRAQGVTKLMMPNGGFLLAGSTDGNGGGRPPDAWKKLCQECANKGAKTILAQKVLEDALHPAFMGAFRFLTEQGYGKATERIEHSGELAFKALVAVDLDRV